MLLDDDDDDDVVGWSDYRVYLLREGDERKEGGGRGRFFCIVKHCCGELRSAKKDVLLIM